jgi:hypothetical protein
MLHVNHLALTHNDAVKNFRHVVALQTAQVHLVKPVMAQIHVVRVLHR